MKKFASICSMALLILSLTACAKTCSAENCNQAVYKSGYCKDHYVPVEIKMSSDVPKMIFADDGIIKYDDNWIIVSQPDVDIGEITWTSSDDTILQVNANGTMVCAGTGTVTLTATSDDGGSCSAKIQCYTHRATKISVSDSTIHLKVGDTYVISPKIEPSDGYAKILYNVFPSDAKKYISVDDDGFVTALASTSSSYLANVNIKLSGMFTSDGSTSISFSVYDDYYNETGILPIKAIGGRYKIDSAGGVELYFNFQNNSDREIKYIDLDVALYNAVKDEIADTITGEKRYPIQYTGPLSPNSSTGEFTGLWKFYNPNFSGTLKFTNVTVTYMDGSTEDIPHDKLNSSDLCSWVKG